MQRAASVTNRVFRGGRGRCETVKPSFRDGSEACLRRQAPHAAAGCVARRGTDRRMELRGKPREAGRAGRRRSRCGPPARRGEAKYSGVEAQLDAGLPTSASRSAAATLYGASLPGGSRHTAGCTRHGARVDRRLADTVRALRTRSHAHSNPLPGLINQSINQSKHICIAPYVANESEALHNGRD